MGEDLFEKTEIKKNISANLNESTIGRLDKLVKDKKRNGFRVNKSSLIDRAINHFLDELERNDTGLFGDVNGW